MTSRPVIFVTGATATGKSDFAATLAQETGGVIFNCDSVQVYNGPCIGSNVPSIEEQNKAPHYLYSYVNPPGEMTAGLFRQDFFETLSKIKPGTPVFVVGGTGFYFQALEKGMFETPPVPEELSNAVREEAKLDLQKLWNELKQADPKSAEKINPTDAYRLCRAIELVRIGTTPSEFRENFKPEPFPEPLLKTGIILERDLLRQRIHRRTLKMLEQGLLKETQGLLDAGLIDWAPLSAVGYKEAVLALTEKRDQKWLEDEISLRTGQLAKRQETWFKRDHDIATFSGEGGLGDFRETCLRFLEGAARIST